MLNFQMKKIVLFFLFAFFTSTSVQSASFSWSKVVESADKKSVFYVDKKTIFKIGNLVYFWQLTDYVISENPDDEKSVVSHNIANCDTYENKFVLLAAYARNMARGTLLFTVIIPDEKPEAFVWSYMDPKNTNQGFIINKVCKSR